MKKSEKVNYTETKLQREYSNECFEGCDFSNLSIHDVYFEDCIFQGCNFSLTKFYNNFSNARFIECKMTGADFTGVSRFASSFRFEKSLLNYVSFAGIQLRKSHFEECNLTESYFNNSDLLSSIFDRCDLSRASFDQTNLEKVDLSTSYNFSIDPSKNRLKKTIFSEYELKGLLNHLDIIIK